jgi:hypothetical protein
MGVTAPTLHSASEKLLHQLVDYFAVDLSFLRRNDHSRGTTTLVAEWPPRSDIPDPDPLGVIRFAGADPIFAATEHLSTVMLTRPDGADADYQDRVRQGSGIEGGVSSATVPLLDANGTAGVLGFIKHGDRQWRDAEINALRAVAALFTQLHARVAAETRLLNLAFHDELTGLANRRALVDHLERRMQAGFPGPVAVIFMDVDRLKAVNSFFGHSAGGSLTLHSQPEVDLVTGSILGVVALVRWPHPTLDPGHRPGAGHPPRPQGHRRDHRNRRLRHRLQLVWPTPSVSRSSPKAWKPKSRPRP